MRRAGSKRGGGATGAGPAARANDALIDSGIATLERATSMDRLGQLEGGPGTTAYSSSTKRCCDTSIDGLSSGLPYSYVGCKIYAW